MNRFIYSEKSKKKQNINDLNIKHITDYFGLFPDER